MLYFFLVFPHGYSKVKQINPDEQGEILVVSSEWCECILKWVSLMCAMSNWTHSTSEPLVMGIWHACYWKCFWLDACQVYHQVYLHMKMKINYLLNWYCSLTGHETLKESPAWNQDPTTCGGLKSLAIYQVKNQGVRIHPSIHLYIHLSIYIQVLKNDIVDHE